MWRVSVRPSQESGLQPVDVVVDARPGATVRDLAVALGEHLAGPGSRVLLAPVTDGVPWGAATPLTESDLRTGDLLDVAVVPADWLDRPARPRPVRATVRVVAGPDAGLTVRVESDALTVGRARSCTVRLADPRVSRLHARVLLVGGPVVVDEGSAHGTRVAGAEVVRPRPVAWGEEIRVGGTVLVLEPGAAGAATAGRADEVLRPPRFGESLEPAELDVPAPPAAPRVQPMPWPMVLMPLLLGGGMFAMTRSPFSLMFMIGFPVMLVLGHLVQRRQQRKEHATELAAWRTEVTEVLDRLDDAAALQRAHAEEDEPETDVLAARLRTRDRTVWNRRTDDADFLAVRAGRGPRPAVVTATVATGGDRVQRELARGEVAERALVPDLPVPLPIGEHGLVAVTGGTDPVDALVRSVVLRLAAHHSPTDVTLTAVLSPARLHLEAWARWLPHTVRRAGGIDPVAVGAGAGQELLELLLAQEPGGPRTVCLVDEDAGVPRRLVEAVATAGPERGVHVVWVGRDAARVPSSTGVLLDVDEQRLLRRDRGGTDPLTRTDGVALVDAWRLARTLTACTDEAAVVPAETAVPDQVRLPDLGADLADPDDVPAILDRWAAARGLRAQIGAGADGVVTIDLREDGPHGLVAGTTGSGKSELLQSLLCSLALNNPPSRITFLLVDYKGGAAFRECADLPHTVGYITDLTPALVQRALVSLNAELTRREHLLAEYGAKDLVAMERSHPEAAPPSMLICVDEFAALLAEVPEFVDGMVNIAQRGRSLGMHMLLATQRPAGVVTPQIKANTDLRIALRMASTEDSQDVIDSDDAARLSRRTPGRAWLRRTGHGTRELVQVAWVGAHEPVRTADDRVTVRAFAARALDDGAAHPAVASRVHERSDLERLVLAAGSAFARSGAQPPLRPWLPPLPALLQLAPADVPGEVLVGTSVADEAAVPGSVDGVRHAVAPGTLVLGLVDRPAQQSQEPFVVDYARAGHLLVLGASGSGKTELLRTVAVAASLADEPAPAVVYGLDAGGGALTGLERLPSVGSVVVEQAPERLQRLLRMLHRTVVERNSLLAARGAVDLTALHEAGVALPRIHVLVDNLPALLDSLEGGGPLRRGHVDMLLAVLQEGRRCGVHVTATSPRRTGVPSAMQSAFGERVVLRMTSADDYQMLGVPDDVLDADSPAGRGLRGRDEVQVATLAGAPGAGVADRLDALAERVAERYAAGPAVAVPSMPGRLPADVMPEPERDEVHLAVEAEFAGAVALRLAEAPLLVAGRDGSGRTSTLAGLGLLAARSTVPPVRTVVVGPDAGALGALLATHAGGSGAAEGVTDGADDVDGSDGVPGTDGADVTLGRTGDPDVVVLAEPEAVVTWADALLAGGSPADGWTLVLVDDAHEWERGWDAGDARRTAVERLAAVAGRARDLGLALVVATDPDDARTRQHVPGVVTTVRRSRRAVLLSPEMADGGLAGVTVPMHAHEPMTGVGRGVLAVAGTVRVVQLVSPAILRERV